MTDEVFGRKDMTVKQLHYTGWPDHGVPEGATMDSFRQMLDLFLIHLLSSEQGEKSIVHCSAGIGRTGTTIGLAHMIANCWAQRNAGQEPKLSIFSVIRRLREQRWGLVQMPEQYQFIYKFLH